jgi:hypothetical protein
MVSLLLLSLVLSTPATAAQAGVPSNPLAVQPPSTDDFRPEMRLLVEEPQAESFDAMAIHPDSDICYKIRTYIFSTGPNPKLLRETTCGPTLSELKKLEGEKPKLVPLNVEDAPTGSLQK